LGEPRGFGELLRTHRVAAGLTQEALAARTDLSVRGIADLERGTRRHPYIDTVHRLSDSLGLTPAQRDEFVVAARRPVRMNTRSGLLEAGRVESLLAELTSFIGRQGLLDDLVQLLSPGVPGCRLVTLTGSGGTGKTRVALHAAAAVRHQFEDGVCFVGLEPISDARLVAFTIAQRLGMPDAGRQPPLERLKSVLRDRQLLLVLNNFEQVLDAAPQLPELLAACPRLQLLVTSRAALRVSAEREVAVAPLALPTRQRLGTSLFPSPSDVGASQSACSSIVHGR
jgi:transcriptional regulator with XRE-family HTH domain